MFFKNKYIDYGHCTIRQTPKYRPEARVWVRISPVAHLYGVLPRYGQGTSTNYIVATVLAIIQFFYWELLYPMRCGLPKWMQRGYY